MSQAQAVPGEPAVRASDAEPDLAGAWHEVTVSGSVAPASSPSASSRGYGY
jgi:hypothetical protein